MVVKLYVFYNQKGRRIIRKVADEIITFSDSKIVKLFSDGDFIRSFEIMSKDECFIDPLTKETVIGRFPTGSKFKINRSDFMQTKRNELIERIIATKQIESIYTANQQLEICPENTVFIFQRLKTS